MTNTLKTLSVSYLMPLAGVIGAGIPDPMVLVPIVLEPMGVLLPDVEP